MPSPAYDDYEAAKAKKSPSQLDFEAKINDYYYRFIDGLLKVT